MIKEIASFVLINVITSIKKTDAKTRYINKKLVIL